MGKLILCSGNRTDRPYVFSTTGTRIYSMEELCYFLYHHAYIIEDSLFSSSLIDWIEKELALPDRADKLRQLIKQQADLKTIVTVIMCSADYYSEYEIKELIRILDDIILMPPIRRNIVKADYLLEHGQYADALNEYDNMIDSQEVGQLTPQVYGNVLHNMAVAVAHSVGMNEACELFRKAFEHNHSKESLKQYLYASKLSKHSDSFEEKLLELEIPQTLLDNFEQEFEQWEYEAKSCEGMSDVNRLENSKRNGRLNEFYRIAEEMVEAWKTTIRP